MKTPLNKERLEPLLKEKSVRGEVVRLAMRRLEGADPEKGEIIAEGLQLLLDRFGPEEGSR